MLEKVICHIKSVYSPYDKYFKLKDSSVDRYRTHTHSYYKNYILTIPYL
jgi:hypothetical protein